jgi:hypothetical protein
LLLRTHGVRWLCNSAAMAVLAVPLLGAGVAQAAIAGASPAQSTTTPAIRSAVALATSPPSVQVCFDKALAPSSAVVSNPGDVTLYAYNSETAPAISPASVVLDPSNVNCMDLGFNTVSGSLDLSEYTAVGVIAGSVAAANGGGLNLADSTTLASSQSHEGTTGSSVAPDLIAVTPNLTANSITFTFDKTVDPGNINATDFFYVNAAGQLCTATAGSAKVVNTPPTSSATGSAAVNVTFPTATGPTCADQVSGAPSVANAYRGFVLPNGVYTASTGNPASEVPNATQGITVGNAPAGGATAVLGLVSASLQPSGNQVLYTFDHPVVAASITPGDFGVVMSDGGTLTAAAANPGNSANSVLVTVNNNLQNYDEYAVQAFVTNGAASDGTTTQLGKTTYTNIPGAVAIGGNAGAFARGFTTGPDLTSVGVNTSTDVIFLHFDQRVSPNSVAKTIPSLVTLLNATGQSVGSPTSVNIPTVAPPGPETITLDVTPAVMALGPVQVAIGDCRFRTFLADTGDPNGCSVPQIVYSTGSSSHLRSLHARHRAVRRSHRGRAVRHHRAHRAVRHV